MWLINTFTILLCCCCVDILAADKLDNYRKTITFYAFSKSNPDGTPTLLNDTLTTFGCDPSGNTTFIVHGWLESIKRPWVRTMANEFLKLRGNCVFFMDYERYSTQNYFSLTPHFWSISDLLLEKVQAIAKPSQMVMFGFSFGARLVMNVGIDLYKKGQRVDKIYACDPAGPGFGGYKENLMISANFVQCIHTSTNYGTTLYNCHQDWRMGNCGYTQPGARKFPYGSHGLCPYFFIASFEHDFVQNSTHQCKTDRAAVNIPKDYIMGPRETRLHYYGDIFSPTAVNPPFNVKDGVIQNPWILQNNVLDVVDIKTKSLEKNQNDLEMLYNDI